MTARRVVTLVCDKPGCPEHYVGGEGQNQTKVRTEAAKLSGWSALNQRTDDPEPTIDLCRWHS